MSRCGLGKTKRPVFGLITKMHVDAKNQTEVFFDRILRFSSISHNAPSSVVSEMAGIMPDDGDEANSSARQYVHNNPLQKNVLGE